MKIEVTRFECSIIGTEFKTEYLKSFNLSIFLVYFKKERILSAFIVCS